MDTLETLFSSQPRVEILRTFLFQPTMKHSAMDLAERSGVTAGTARSHAHDLAAIDLIHESEKTDDESGQTMIAWQLNRQSKLRQPLHEIILQHQEITPTDIHQRLEKVGNIHLLVLSGIFAGVDDRPIDILIVGDGVDTTKLSRTLTWIEKSLGTELRYTNLSRDEFTYRHNVYDRLIRDVLDYPHHVLVDEMNVTH